MSNENLPIVFRKSKSKPKYNGIVWDKHFKKWRATVIVNGKMKQIGISKKLSTVEKKLRYYYK